jgi:hypothetical protein
VGIVRIRCAAVFGIGVVVILVACGGDTGQPMRLAVPPPTSAPDDVNGVSQSALHACVQARLGPCEDQVAGLRQCQQAHLVCNPAAADDLKAKVLQPGPGAALTAEGARRAASNAAIGPISQISDREMTLLELQQTLFPGEGTFPYQPTDLVRVVTVHAPTWTDGGLATPSRVVDMYTVVYHEATAHEMVVCLGDGCPAV